MPGKEFLSPSIEDLINSMSSLQAAIDLVKENTAASVEIPVSSENSQYIDSNIYNSDTDRGKIKEFKMLTDGSLKLKYEIKHGGNTAYNAESEVQLNGVVIDTLNTKLSDYIVYDANIPFKKNDVLSLHIGSQTDNDSVTAYVKNIELLYDVVVPTEKIENLL